MYGACTSESHADSSDVPDESAGFSRRFSADATLVLIGFHGAGKKTLGIIASVALRRRFVDFDAVFRQQVNLSPHDYIAANGLARYRTVEAEVSQRLLETCDNGCVIVGLGGAASQQQRELLRTFARTHPVVYVRRGEADLRQFITASQERFERFIKAGDAFFQACSNFEFFNLTLGDVQQTQGRRLPSSLKLKEAERVFVRFLHHVYGRQHCTLLSPDAFSPSQTLAMQVPLWWLDSDQRLDSLDAGADALNLIVNAEELNSANIQSRLARGIALLRMHSRVPIIVDIRPPGDSDTQYPRVLEMALRLAPDARVITTKGSSRAIATYHEHIPLGWDSRPSEVYNLPKKAEDLGFECLRLTGESGVSQDNLACVALRQSLAPRTKTLLSMYNTGPLGRTSVCLNPVLSPVVLPDSGIIGVTLPERFTIVGQAVQNSLSPAMHNAAYAACGLPHSYDFYKPTRLHQVRTLLEDPGYGGLAVSLPYKTAILPFLDQISPDARDINAVNTVVIQRQYEPSGAEVTIRKGYNTDYIGVRHCIQKHLSPANAIRDGTTALVIGAGGMARAAVYACYELGVRRICIYNRTVENAEALAEYYHEWADRQKVKFRIEVIRSASDRWPADFRLPSIVVSCLPGQDVHSASPVDLRISKDWLQSTTGGVFLEVAYGPCKTLLLEQVLEHTSTGWIVVDGLSLLVEQGIAQYELFTKRPAPVHVMRRVIHEEARQQGYIHVNMATPTYQPAIMSASLGRAWAHGLVHKIACASAAGFNGIEIFYEDLEYHARSLANLPQTASPSDDTLLTAASNIHTLCTTHNLTIIGLQPFLFYEGLKDRAQHAKLITKMKLWLHLAHALHTNTIQIPANFLPASELITDDNMDTLVADLQQIADLGAAQNPPIRFAYENLCWSTLVDTPAKLWNVVSRVDRPNFGVCLDTFNIAGRIWADPAAESGKTENADAKLKEALERMVAEIDVAKVFYIQVVDAERMAAPLVPGHEFYVEGQPLRMSWSRNARTFMYEVDRGAYLPVEEVAKAIIYGLGYEGFVSMELFSRTMAEEGENVSPEHAARGIRAWETFAERLQLNQ
ncbi:hypothetical protein BJX68DRAFT_274769 [Aspergillus pseudodeflectus]|uniref:Quinate repressor protein n=1 Tax=Aspergillus pseudodeflectus TaxID=176178 RepID=A0ABR4KQR2_9EURO